MIETYPIESAGSLRSDDEQSGEFSGSPHDGELMLVRALLAMLLAAATLTAQAPQVGLIGPLPGDQLLSKRFDTPVCS